MHARTRWTLAATFLSGAVMSTPAMAADAPDPRALMDKASELRKLPGSEGVSVMTIYNAKGQSRVRKIAMITKLVDGGKTEKKLIRFLSPADVKGTGFLTYDYEVKDDAMWLYMPALRKTRRIVSSEQSKSFMGSEFSYADMNIPVLDDFTYKLLGEESMGDVSCWKIEATAKSDDVADENGFRKRVAWLGKEDLVSRKVDFYGFDGEIFKVMTTQDVRVIDAKTGRYRAFFMEMNNRENGRRSTLKMEQLELVPEVKDEYFTTRFLERE